MEHEQFILTVVKSIKDYEAGNRLVLTSFTNFMKRWVFAHIAVMDVKYIEYFKKININRVDSKRGPTPEEMNRLASMQL